MQNTFGIIVQARIGSTRLPKKMLKPFFNEKGIFELLLIKLKVLLEKYKIIIATTTNPQDDIIVEMAKKYNFEIYRGSENNVLDRFINAADEFKIDNIIRICADNPFLDYFELTNLIHFAQNNSFDYIGYSINNAPSIKTHYGFWAEFVKKTALKKVLSNTNEQIYLEHVTNYIYTNPKLFNIHFIAVKDERITTNHKIRLTLDTAEDFNILKEIYQNLYMNYKKYGIFEIIDFLEKNPSYYEKMDNQIRLQKK
jgi:spore coat polysaccharide biosynthesis protein SpsF (cytidylyltransferase family)